MSSSTDESFSKTATATLISLPLNFTVLVNSQTAKDLKPRGKFQQPVITLSTAESKTISVGYLTSQLCHPSQILIPKAVQSTLGIKSNDTVTLGIPKSLDNIKTLHITPMFDTFGKNYVKTLKAYFEIEPRIIARDSVFFISGNLPFKIVRCSPGESGVTTTRTQIVQIKAPDNRPGYTTLPEHLDSLALSKTVIDQIQQNIRLPLLHPNLIKSFGFSSSSGVLIYGPRGSGKSAILSALSHDIGVPSASIDMKELITLDSDEAQEKLEECFTSLTDHQVSLLLIDNLHLLLQRRLVSFLFAKLDQALALEGSVVVATASSPTEIDPALCRFGRFGVQISLEEVTAQQRERMVRLCLTGLNAPEEAVRAAVARCGEMALNEIPAAVAAGVLAMVGERSTKLTDSAIAQAAPLPIRADHFGGRRPKQPQPKPTVEEEEEEEEPPPPEPPQTKKRRRQTPTNPFQAAPNPFGAKDVPSFGQAANPFAKTMTEEAGAPNPFTKRVRAAEEEGAPNPFAKRAAEDEGATKVSNSPFAQQVVTAQRRPPEEATNRPFQQQPPTPVPANEPIPPYQQYRIADPFGAHQPGAPRRSLQQQQQAATFADPFAGQQQQAAMVPYGDEYYSDDEEGAPPPQPPFQQPTRPVRVVGGPQRVAPPIDDLLYGGQPQQSPYY